LPPLYDVDCHNSLEIVLSVLFSVPLKALNPEDWKKDLVSDTAYGGRIANCRCWTRSLMGWTRKNGSYIRYFSVISECVKQPLHDERNCVFGARHEIGLDVLRWVSRGRGKKNKSVRTFGVTSCILSMGEKVVRN